MFGQKYTFSWKYNTRVPSDVTSNNLYMEIKNAYICNVVVYISYVKQTSSSKSP